MFQVSVIYPLVFENDQGRNEFSSLLKLNDKAMGQPYNQVRRLRSGTTLAPTLNHFPSSNKLPSPVLIDDSAYSHHDRNTPVLSG
jgi:hypothetical protein